MAYTAAPEITVAGVANIYLDLYQPNEDDIESGLQFLGRTRNGADITKEGYFIDVPGDENGGDEGPPIDVEYLGETARVRLEMTKFDGIMANLLTKRNMQAVTVGKPETGKLLFQAEDNAVRLLILSAGSPINYPRAIPRMPIELNKGTRFTTIVFEFECHKDANGVLWNTETG